VARSLLCWAWARPLDEPAHGQRLKRDAHRVEVAGLVRGRRVDHGALLRNSHHEPLGGELAQHLADRRAGDPDLLDQLTRDEPLPGLQLEVEDRGAHAVEQAAKAATRVEAAVWSGCRRAPRTAARRSRSPWTDPAPAT